MRYGKHEEVGVVTQNCDAVVEMQYCAISLSASPVVKNTSQPMSRNAPPTDLEMFGGGIQACSGAASFAMREQATRSQRFRSSKRLPAHSDNLASSTPPLAQRVCVESCDKVVNIVPQLLILAATHPVQIAGIHSPD
eukprot:CAMPEP_0195639722 /NCGR_PEP_ID=MMETSP0815-20121206/25748_1 /TAXON_ID=97485 /ORGANISM="Prymnesium parvum, Strain Texoma1" /LENGTH=136 /DNA_ID=CAMNT_0040782305 /DNA_START=114 /DNA_END=525 /DNA_ORIENTATION=-